MGITKPQQALIDQFLAAVGGGDPARLAALLEAGAQLTLRPTETGGETRRQGADAVARQLVHFFTRGYRDFSLRRVGWATPAPGQVAIDLLLYGTTAIQRPPDLQPGDRLRQVGLYNFSFGPARLAALACGPFRTVWASRGTWPPRPRAAAPSLNYDEPQITGS